MREIRTSGATRGWGEFNSSPLLYRLCVTLFLMLIFARPRLVSAPSERFLREELFDGVWFAYVEALAEVDARLAD